MSLPDMTTRRFITFAALLGALPLTGLANAFTFSTSSLGSLAHGTAYTWALGGTTFTNLQTALHSGQVVSAATLTITNLDDWRVEPKDVLYVNILNGLYSGIRSYTYNGSPSTYDTVYGSDYFNSASSHLHYGAATPGSLLVYTGTYNTSGNPGTWSDPDTPSDPSFDLVINFTPDNLAVLSGFLAADYGTTTRLGLGFDPNCHYYDSCVKLQIWTEDRKVPDGGATIGLLGAGLLALLAGKRLTGKNRRAM